MDLLFSNFSYFWRVYFGIEIWQFALLCLICLLPAFLIFYNEIKTKDRLALVKLILTAIYLASLIAIPLLGRQTTAERQIILNPFFDIARLHNNTLRIHLLRAVISNTLFFIPLGLITSMKIKAYTIIKALIIGFMLSLLIEGLQYLLMRGILEGADLLCNTIGSVLGASIYLVYKKILSKYKGEIHV